MLLSTAILVGLLGSFHCLGMCAPITWAVPQSSEKRAVWLASKLTYNLGRVITYSILGALIGFAGQMLSFAGIQQGLSIGAGILLILGVFLLKDKALDVPMIRPLGKFVVWVKMRMTKLIMAKGWKGNLSLGLINGLLPCGLVYAALVGAMSMGSVLGGAGYMTLFGLGTFPMMLAVAFFGKVVGQRLKWKIAKWTPKFILVLGFLFVLRGLNLGVPYLSPKINNDQNIIECEVDALGTSFIEIGKD